MEPSFIINLWAGSSPLPLERLPPLDLEHLEVFTSRTREEGRERFRLHVGYFDNPRAAERVLQRVRDAYPTAWVVPAERHLPVARFNGIVTARKSPAAAPWGERILGMIQPQPPKSLPPTIVDEPGALPMPSAAVASGGPHEVVPPLVLPVPSELAKILPAILQSPASVDQPGGATSKLSVIEWYAEALTQAPPRPRSWFERLARRFTR